MTAPGGREDGELLIPDIDGCRDRCLSLREDCRSIDGAMRPGQAARSSAETTLICIVA
jgi:hypothetical protein